GLLEQPDGISLAKLAARYSDGIILANENIPDELSAFCQTEGKPVLPFSRAALEDGSYMDDYNSFYDSI
ncbi:MAG: hypothetical protein ACI39U_08565, partial [Candidatus Cryptobacteroides sp.]